MSDNVVSLDEHRPHIALLLVTGDATVMPVSLLQKIVSGDISLLDIDDWEIHARSIIAAWLWGLGIQVDGYNEEEP